MKFFTLISAAAGQDKKQFQEWFLKQHAPMVLEHARGIQRYIVNLADTEPPPVENIGFVAPEAEAPYDVITEMWLGSPEDFKDRARLVWLGGECRRGGKTPVIQGRAGLLLPG